MPVFPHVPAPVAAGLDTDVVVVGAGVVGAAAAWQLARRGVAVLLLDRFDAGHTHGASHGTCRLLRPVGAADRHAELAAASLPLWRELEALTGAELLHRTGGVDHGDPVRTAERAEVLAAGGMAHRWLDAEEAAARWPGLRFTGPVLHQPDRSGRIHADLAVSALTAAAIGEGAVVRRRVRVERVEVRGPQKVRLSTSGGTVRARRVVLAAGGWTAELAGAVAALPALRVTEEQPALFPPLAVNPCVARDTDWPTVVHHLGAADAPPARAGYAVADPCGDVEVGLDGAGPPCGPDRRTFVPEPGRLRRLQDYVAAYLPGLDHRRPNPVSRTRTEVVDGGFVLAATGPVVVGAGFGGAAFSVAPAAGRVLAELATGVASAARLVGAR